MSALDTNSLEQSQPLTVDFPKVDDACYRLSEVCHRVGPLDKKTRELVALGIAIGANLEDSAHAHIQGALKAGAIPEELWHTVVLSTPTLGFPHTLRAMSWQNKSLRKAFAE